LFRRSQLVVFCFYFFYVEQGRENCVRVVVKLFYIDIIIHTTVG